MLIIRKISALLLEISPHLGCQRLPIPDGILGAINNGQILIGPERVTLPRLLRERGYTTAGVGKWHLGFQMTSPVDYTKPLTPGIAEAGFTSFFGLSCNHGDEGGVWFGNDHMVGRRSATLTPLKQDQRNWIGLDAPQRTDTEVMDTIVRRAQDLHRRPAARTRGRRRGQPRRAGGVDGQRQRAGAASDHRARLPGCFRRARRPLEVRRGRRKLHLVWR
jgi:hypothetical protein